MKKSKVCITCLRELPFKEFRSTRNVCKECRSAQIAANKSSSPYAYIKGLFRSLKYSRKAFDWEINCEYVETLWDKQEGKCALSGVFLTWQAGEGRQDFNVSIDRKDPNKGYIIGNIQLVAQRVNIMKHTLGESEFYWWCKNITHNKELCK